MKNNKILYVGAFGLPTSQASGVRVYNIGKVFRNVGYKVDFLSSSYSEEISRSTINYDDFNFLFRSQNKRYSVFRYVKEYLELFTSKEMIKRIKDYCKSEKPNFIIFYNAKYSLVKGILKYCKKNNIKIISDVTEWYEQEFAKNLGEKIMYSSVNKRVRKLDNQIKNIIAVSPYLDEFYKSKSCNTIFVPPIFDLNLKKYNINKEIKPLTLVYAGSPGNKDIILPVLQALEKINHTNILVHLNIAGLSEENIITEYKIENPKKIGIQPLGKIPREEVIKLIKKADYGILFRHKLMYAKAGFSTKFAECMSLGTPMICNKVGGGEVLIKHMENGVLTETADFKSITAVLHELVNTSQDKHQELRINALITATKFFDVKSYEISLGKYLENVK